MFGRRRWLAAVAVPGVLIGGAVAFAATRPPVAEQLEATIVLRHAIIDHRACEGSDGLTYFEQRITARGTSTGDEVLTGDVLLRFRGEFNENNVGWDEGSLRIRDAEGEWSAQGRFALAANEEYAQGILVGETRRPATSGGERARLFAGMRFTLNDDRSATIQVGGDLPEGGLPAVHLAGKCTTPFRRFVVQIPPPGVARAGATGVWPFRG